MTDPTSAGPDQWRFDDLGALYINCTLKRSPEPSHRQVLQADILVLCGQIWLGDNSSVTKRVIERLYACSSLLNDAGHAPGALLKRAGGIPAHGNQRSEWEAGCRFDSDNPEHR